MVAIVDHDSCLRSSGPAYGALVSDASNVPVEPGNDLPPPGVVYVRGSPASPRSPTGHPRNKQNGSEELPSVQLSRGPGASSPRRTTPDHEDALPHLGVAKPAH